MKFSFIQKIDEVKEIDIELPAYFERFGTMMMIAEDGTLIKAANIYMSVTKPQEPGRFYQEAIVEALSSKPSTRLEFLKVVQSFYDNIGQPMGSIPSLSIAS